MSISSSETRTYTSRCRATLPQGHVNLQGPTLMTHGDRKEYHTQTPQLHIGFFLPRGSYGSSKVVINTVWKMNFSLPSHSPPSRLLPLPFTCVDSKSPHQHTPLPDTISDFAFLSPVTGDSQDLQQVQGRNETTLGDIQGPQQEQRKYWGVLCRMAVTFCKW